jgi:SAM-dependent methyltransferase
MAERTGGIRGFLSRPGLYTGFQRLLGANSAHARFLAEHVTPRPDERLLDMGCGPGRVIPLLPPVDYVGIDLSPHYIAKAQQKFGNRGRFICADVSEAEVPARSFDIVTMMGLLHHLEDARARSTLRSAAACLADEGRLVAMEPAFVDGQNPIARWLIARDRGTRVRAPDQYVALAETYFETVALSLEDDLLRVPYTHAILKCEGPRRGKQDRRSRANPPTTSDRT